jgi:hypothetical protein
VLFVLLRYADSGCLPLVSSNSSYRIYQKSLLNCQHLPRGLFAHFHNTIGELYTIFFFFPIKTDDETTILVVYDIYFINQWLKMTIIKTNKQKTKKTKKKKKKKIKKKIKKTTRQTTVQLKSYTKVYYVWICLKRLIRMDISTFVK